jgi:hypothetical protein
VAVGLPYGAGNVRIYAINGDAVTKLGADIAGFGAYSVSMSSAPIYRVAIGSPFANASAGEITVHAWDGFAGTWNQENTATMTGSITGSSLAAAELVTRYPRAPLAVDSTDAVSSALTLLDGLEVWYEFDGDATQMLVDSSGNGYDLTNNGATFSSVDPARGDGSMVSTATTTYATMPATLHPYTIWNGNGITFSVWFKYSHNIDGRIFDWANDGPLPTHFLALIIIRKYSPSGYRPLHRRST